MKIDKLWHIFFLIILISLLFFINILFFFNPPFLELFQIFLIPIVMLFIWCLTASFQERSNKDQIRRERLLHNIDIYAPILGELKTIIDKLTNFQENIEASEIRRIHQKAEWWQIDLNFIDRFNKLEGGFKGYNDSRKNCRQICENYFKEELKKFKLEKNKKELKRISRKIGVSPSKEIFLSILNSDEDKLKELLSWNLDNKKAQVSFLAQEYILNRNDSIKSGMNVYNKFKLIKEFDELRKIRKGILGFLYQLQKELGEAVREPWKVLY